jgi:acetyl esterase
VSFVQQSGASFVHSRHVVDGPRGELTIHVRSPRLPSSGVLIAVQADAVDERTASATGMILVTVDGVVSSDEQSAAAVDDWVTVICWAAEHSWTGFGTDRVFVTARSLGAYHALLAFLRLKAEHPSVLDRVEGVCLNYGLYDVGRTPGVSPLSANLTEMPPALFVVGDNDPLLNDSLFMAARWQAADNFTDLKVWPGLTHGFLAAGSIAAQLVEYSTNEWFHFIMRTLDD